MKRTILLTALLAAVFTFNTRAAAPLQGTVVETMDSGGYTYLKFKSGDEEYWAATAPVKLEIGQEVSVSPSMEMKDFQSPTLGRTFQSIYFTGSVLPDAYRSENLPDGHPIIDDNDGALPEGHPEIGGSGLPDGHPPVGEVGGMDSMDKMDEVDVSKAQVFQSLESFLAEAKSLEGTPVKISGKVSKWNKGILGRNWAHLKEGSADVTVTTQADMAADDEVTVVGTVRLNQDFGGGYFYEVLVENAVPVGTEGK